MTESDIIDAVARWLPYWRYACIPNVLLKIRAVGGEMDLAVLTRHGMLWEIEAKTNVADWQRESRKTKWRAVELRGPEALRVNRFFFAVPEELDLSRPAWLPKWTGLIVVNSQGQARKCRDAPLIRTEKPTDGQRSEFLAKATHRYWKQRFDAQERR